MKYLFALCLSLLPTAVMAEPWACAFTVECIASDSCGESAYDVELIAADHEGALFLSSVNGDSPVMRLTERDVLPATYASNGSAGPAELLTVEADGTALMTVHILGGTGMAVTYFGTCEELS